MFILVIIGGLRGWTGWVVAHPRLSKKWLPYWHLGSLWSHIPYNNFYTSYWNDPYTFSLVQGPYYTPILATGTGPRLQNSTHAASWWHIWGCNAWSSARRCLATWEDTNFKQGATSGSVHPLWAERRNCWPTLDTNFLVEQILLLVKFFLNKS
jgi:hypothetical protein